MFYAAALVALHIAAFALGAINAPLADAVLPILESAICLVVLLLPSVRHAILDTLQRYWPAALAFAFLVFATAFDSGLVGDRRGALGMSSTRADAFHLIGFAMGALSVAGIALAKGRRAMMNALLAGAVALGVLAIAQQMQTNSTLFDAMDETACVFALLAALGAFAMIDALTQRAPAVTGRRRSRAERLWLPAAGFMSALIGLALTSSIEIIAGLGIGAAALAIGLIVRERTRGSGLLLLGALALAGAAGGGTLLYLNQRNTGAALLPYFDFNSPMAWKLAAFIGIWAMFLLRLATSTDRRRHPSRGLSLAVAGLSVITLAGPSASAPAAFATLALLVGLAATYADWLASLNPDARNSG